MLCAQFAEKFQGGVHIAMLLMHIAFIIALFLLSTTATVDRLAVTSYPVIAALIEELGGGLWHVTHIVPPGMDPHEYSLSVEEVLLLNKATLLVITNHTHFEERILDLWRKGLISPKELVVVEEVEGMRFLLNPMTGSVNLHLPYYDPDNLIALAKDLTSRLISLDPANSRIYETSLERFVSDVQGVAKGVEKKFCVAVASTPLVQYAVNWAGVRIEKMLEAEHEVPSPPGVIAEVIEGLKDGRYDVAVVMAVLVEEGWKPSSRHDEMLAKEAKRAGVPVLFVPDPFGGMINMKENLKLIVEQLRAIDCGEAKETGTATEKTAVPLAPIAVVTLVITIIAIALSRKR